MNAKELIDSLELSPHPEGGYYRRIYSSQENHSEGRKLISSIHYLLEGEGFSAFHSLDSTELWFFHSGEPINIYQIAPNGELKISTLSCNLKDNLQLVIEPNTWFAADIPSMKGYSLVSCTVVPEFSFNHFQLAKREDLIKEYPQHKAIITRLTR